MFIFLSKYYIYKDTAYDGYMMMLWSGNAFYITGPMWGESNSHKWIPLQ